MTILLSCSFKLKQATIIVVCILFNMVMVCDCFMQPFGSRSQQGYQAVSDVEFQSVNKEPRGGGGGVIPKLVKAGMNNDVDDDMRTKTTIITTSDNKSAGARILDLSIPALGALLIDPLLTLADTAFVGRFSDSANELAGMGSAAAILSFSFYLFNFLCSATTPLVSSKRSSGNEREALAIGGQAISLAIGLGLILAFGLLMFRQPLLDVMGTSVSGPEANAFGIDFLTLRAVAAPAVFCISASTGILRGYLDTKTPIAILVVANIVNLALDVILIAFAHMGPSGAAIATTTAEWISALLFLGVLSGTIPAWKEGQLGRKEEDEKTLVVTPALSMPPWEEIKPLIVASSSLFFRSLSLNMFFSGAAAFAARGGETIPGGAASSISAHQIAMQLWLLCSFIADALAAASQGLVADGIGRNDPDDVQEISKTVFIYSGVLGGILAALLQVGYSTTFLLGFFTSDAGTQSALAKILALIVLAQPLNSLVFAADGILQGASEFSYQAKSMALSVVIATVAFIILENVGESDTLVHVWISLIILQLMRGVTAAVKIVDKDGPVRLLSSSKL